MSLRDKQELVSRIWTHSKATHTNKLMLFALAEHADEDGFCWPSRDTLGQMVGHGGKKEKYIQRNALDNLISLSKLNEIIIWEQPVKRGRGYTNIYLITVGLTDEQIREIVKRRFQLTSDEIEHVLDQKSELYIQLCLDHKISIDTLKVTRKGDTGITDTQEMSDTGITQNSQMGDTEITHNPEESKKGDTEITRTESLDPLESSPNKDSFSSPNGEEGDKSPPPRVEPLPVTENEQPIPADPPPETKPKRVRAPKPPAFQVYVEKTEYYSVTKEWVEKIAQIVGDKPEDLIRWGDTITTFTGRGKWKGNVQDMLDWYQNGIPDYSKKANTNGHNQNQTTNQTRTPAQGHSAATGTDKAEQNGGLSEVSAKLGAALRAQARGGRDPT